MVPLQIVKEIGANSVADDVGDERIRTPYTCAGCTADDKPLELDFERRAGGVQNTDTALQGVKGLGVELTPQSVQPSQVVIVSSQNFEIVLDRMSEGYVTHVMKQASEAGKNAGLA
jgi:hypothetical protein